MFNLFFIFTALCTMTSINHCAQNSTQETQLIIFNEGSKTKIPRTFFVIDYRHGPQSHSVLEIGKTDVLQKFEDVFLEEISVIKKGIDEERMTIFRPTVIKITKNHSVENLGSLLFNSHNEAHEEAHRAIKAKKVIFYSYKQGAIIYFVDAPNIAIIGNKQKEIDQIIESNIPEYIELQLFRTFSGF